MVDVGVGSSGAVRLDSDVLVALGVEVDPCNVELGGDGAAAGPAAGVVAWRGEREDLNRTAWMNPGSAPTIGAAQAGLPLPAVGED